MTRLKPHPVFTRSGADLTRELPVTLGEALLGGEVPVGTLTGRVLLIPPGTQNGRTFRLAGQGLPRFKGDGRGDLFVTVRVVLPTDLSDEAKAAAATTSLDHVDQTQTRGPRSAASSETTAMKLDRYTEKAQEAILAAQRLATDARAPSLDAEHLLAALLETPRASPPRRCAASAPTCPGSASSSPRCLAGAPGSRAAR